jgi:formate dehydrogenase gamma subunit
MKRCVLLTVGLVLVLVCGLTKLAGSGEAQAQGSPAPNTPAARPAQVNGAASEARPTLQCQGCHAAGKTLPYLGGAVFHTEAHTQYDHSFHALALRNGKKGAACVDCHTRNGGGDLTTILPASDSKSTINRANVAETCGRCHGDSSVMQGSGITSQPLLSYRESVHAQAVAQGNAQAAVCTDCHNSHDIRAASDAQSTIFKINVPQTCGRCHENEAKQFTASIHGQAVARGVSRAPVCTDCHGIHNIKAPWEKNTGAASVALATESCAQCHAGVALTQEFGVAGERVSSYQASYHGLASKFGSKLVANCASCHGVHNILPSSDPRSMINAANLPQTCGQCHVGAGTNFTRGRIHLGAELTAGLAAGRDLSGVGTRIVRWIYLPLIVLVIGGMLAHNALVWRKKAAAKWRREPRTISRLSRNQRWQHWLLLTSFLALVFSGFALQYPESWLGWLLGSSETLRRMIHRIAAVVMLLTGVYHLFYLVFSAEGRQWVRDMLPRLKDFRDVLQNFGYYLGVRNLRPKLARFGYAEKAEYWAVVWGTAIMGLTGLMIWFKISVFSFLARWWLDIALSIHFYEAILATLAIIVWHFYQVIFDPDVYPVNFAFLDGRVSEESYKEEHELAYEQLQKQETEAAAREGSQEPD